MRLSTLSEMLTMLRSEARLSVNPAHGAHLTDGHIALLRRVQEELYDAYEWPLLQVAATVTVAAGARYGTYPDTMAFEGVTGAFSRDASGDWRPLGYGIGAGELNTYDSDAGETSDVILRWQHYLSPAAETPNQNMFEVWPIPDSDQSVRFAGKRALLPLVNPDTDTSTLDAPLIVLHAAAEILAGQKAEDAGLKLQKAQARLDLIRRRQATPGRGSVNMAATSRRAPLRPGIDYIP